MENNDHILSCVHLPRCKHVYDCMVAEQATEKARNIEFKEAINNLYDNALSAVRGV